MYTYRNINTGERRRFISLQHYPWQLVSDASSETFDPITANPSSDWGSSDTLSSSSDDTFSGGGGSFGGGGSDSSW